MRDLKAVAMHEAKLRDVKEAYDEVRRAEADNLTMQGFAALKTFHGGRVRGSTRPIDVAVQYPGVVLKTDYDKPAYHLRVRYVRGAIEIAAEKTSGSHYISPVTVDFKGSTDERLEAACVQIATWIGEELK